MNRREFIGIASAVAVLPMPQGHDGVVLFDARYACSQDFAARSGFTALATNEDVVSLWFGNESFRGARQVAGVTPHSDFEIVKRLLKEKGKRLISAAAVRAADRPASLVSWHFA